MLGFDSGLNLLLPPTCPLCREPTATAHGFCATCWNKADFITTPFCSCCGLPFEYNLAEQGEMRCGACLEETPHFTAARAALRYNEAAKAFILPFKYADATHFAPALARLLVQAGGELLAASEILMPVPLHFFRLWQRGYNQAALLVHALHKHTGKPALLHSLKRRRHTPSQGGLSRRARQANMQAAFTLPLREKPKIAGKQILLIDDVLTTGATANACSKVLLKAGAAAVRVLVLARVSRVE